MIDLYRSMVEGIGISEPQNIIIIDIAEMGQLSSCLEVLCLAQK